MKVRLQKRLAEAGVGSRRSCEELIRGGRVTVGGKVATLGSSVDADSGTIAVDGRSVSVEPKEYWLLNKPPGVLSAVSDARGRPTVVECVPASARVFPVGRLDLDTTGLLLLTNDGELAARLLHPRYHVAKEYLATVRGSVSQRTLRQLRDGIALEDGLTSAALVQVVDTWQRGEQTATKVLLTIHEGRKRQVRRMFEAVGHRVITLHRARFAGLTEEDLDIGQARRLTGQEVSALWEQVEGH